LARGLDDHRRSSSTHPSIPMLRAFYGAPATAV
jgi:hypothetical protein